jgi:hypothetical protein
MRRCLSHTTLPFGKYGPQTFQPIEDDNDRVTWQYLTSIKGQTVHIPAKTFDEVPLSYLDWLSGQDYVNYGWLRERLTAYLSRPVIQRELMTELRLTARVELGPDLKPTGRLIEDTLEPDDSYEPLFICHPDRNTRLMVTCEIAKTQQRREPMPKEYIPELDPDEAPMTPMRAWETIADAAVKLEQVETPDDFTEFHRIRDLHLLNRALGKMHGNFHARAKLREAYRTAKLRSEAYREPEPIEEEAPIKRGRRRKLKVRRRRLKHALAIVSIEQLNAERQPTQKEFAELFREVAMAR